jgi:twitching motility protein PilT
LSRLDPLVDALKKTEADEVRLVAGERIYLMRAGRRIEIGREPLQQASLLALAGEVLDPKDLASVQKEKRSAQVERKGEPIEVTVQTVAGVLTISVKRAPPPKTAAPAPPAAPAPEQGAYASVPAMAAVRPPPASPNPNHPAHPIDELLEEMMSKSASDLHLTSGSSPVLRVHGEIHFLTERPVLTSPAIMALVTPILNDKAKKDFEEKHDADFAYEVPGLARFRVNVFVDRMGVGAVMRQIPIEIIPADKLGLPQAVLDLCFLTKGLVVVTGPTGSGKSTTLAGMVDFINKNRNDHIITIEDPIEFVHKNIKCLVNQREVGQHTKSFKNALRAALREDPDIVLVGEMRDLETISIAIETAETGHLVFGTLHTTTAISTVDRIIDQFPTDQQEQIRVMLAESLKGVIAQVLCKKIGGGRVAAMEILLGNSAVTSLIREAKTFQIPSIMQTSRGAGMVTMNDSLLALVQKKLVDPKEAWMKSVDKSGLVGMLKSAGIQLQAT